MGSRSHSSAKVKVTASLNADLVRQLDEFAEQTNVESRSQLIEDALRKWCEEQKRHKIEKEIEAYYLALSDKERDEDQQWSQLAAESSQNLWEE